jgi:RNA polymerase sigma factor (sigma-70 family)
MSDQEPLREYLEKGSESAFQNLVQRHFNLVYATALRRLGDPGQAEETAQNVFIALARRVPLPRAEVNLAGWLYQATLLEASQRYREEYRRQRREASAIEMGTTMNPEPSLLKSLSATLDEALMNPREKDRRALLLRFFEDKNFREVGRELGIGEDAAQKRVAKSLESLTRWFNRRGYGVATSTVTAAVLAEAAKAAAPAGLATLVAHAALHSAATGSLTGFGLVVAKLMALLINHWYRLHFWLEQRTGPACGYL